jgi:hypothetical protein
LTRVSCSGGAVVTSHDTDRTVLIEDLWSDWRSLLYFLVQRRLSCSTRSSYSGRMTATTISFRADEQTMAELRQLAGDGNLSDAIRELIHAQYTSRLYAQAARDAERLRNDPADLAEIRALNEELDEISAW